VHDQLTCGHSGDCNKRVGLPLTLGLLVSPSERISSFCAPKRVKDFVDHARTKQAILGVKPFPRNHEVTAKREPVNGQALHFVLTKQSANFLSEQLRCAVFWL
jgi:hypothetical protein